MNREFSAGGVVYKRSSALRAKKLEVKSQKSKVLWLVTKSAPSKLIPEAYWRLPKGWIDDADGGKKPGSIASGKNKASEEDLRNAALNEVKEEGGVEAKIIKKIGNEVYFYTSEDGKVMKFVTFYLMEWLTDLPEGYGSETSEVSWLPYERARKRLKYSREKKVLEKAKKLMDLGVQESMI